MVSGKRFSFAFILVATMVMADSPSGTQSPDENQQCAVNVVNTINDNTKMEEIIEERMDKLETKIEVDLNAAVRQIVTEVHRIMRPSLNNTDTPSMDEYQPSPLLHSCDEVKSTWPDSVSDYYLIADSTGHARHVYCSMDNTCGDANGGWMRVGYLNMSDPSEQCPPGFRLYEENGVRACGKQQSGAGCQSVKFPSYSISYSQVCGRVTGYQKASPDAIRSSNNINGAYVDGVSITRGNPRKHVWTFMAALQENTHFTNGVHECPCAPNSPVTPQSFIGNDYFCESGSPGAWDFTTFYTNDPLWDGKQCGLIEKACCLAPGLPWFNKVLGQPTTDYIELRVCGDQLITDEDVPVGYYEIYVK